MCYQFELVPGFNITTTKKLISSLFICNGKIVPANGVPRERRIRLTLKKKCLLCSDGISTVGKYTEGRRDDVRIPFSVLKSAKFFSLWLGRFFRNSLIDCKRIQIKNLIQTFSHSFISNKFLQTIKSNPLNCPTCGIGPSECFNFIFANFQCQSIVDGMTTNIKKHIFPAFLFFFSFISHLAPFVVCAYSFIFFAL